MEWEGVAAGDVFQNKFWLNTDAQGFFCWSENTDAQGGLAVMTSFFPFFKFCFLNFIFSYMEHTKISLNLTETLTRLDLGGGLQHLTKFRWLK